MELRLTREVRFLGVKGVSALNITFEGSICTFCENMARCEKTISDELKKLGIASFRLTVYSCRNFKLMKRLERKPLII